MGVYGCHVREGKKKNRERKRKKEENRKKGERRKSEKEKKTKNKKRALFLLLHFFFKDAEIFETLFIKHPQV